MYQGLDVNSITILAKPCAGRLAEKLFQLTDFATALMTWEGWWFIGAGLYCEAKHLPKRVCPIKCHRFSYVIALCLKKASFPQYPEMI